MHQLELLLLEFNDFKSFTGKHSFDLNREAGLYFITGINKIEPELGANGAAKSTIWDALTWCLWGKTIRDERPADAILPWHVKKPNTWVRLVYKRNGEMYEIKRTRKPNEIKLYVGDDDDNSRVLQQKEVAETFGMSEDLFRRALVIGQFGTQFLDMTPEPQTKMFAEALALDTWLDAADAAGKHASACEARAAEARLDEQRHRGGLEEADAAASHAAKEADRWAEDKAARLKAAEQEENDAKQAVQDSAAKAPPRPRNAQGLEEQLRLAEQQLASNEGLLRQARQSLLNAERLQAATDARLKIVDEDIAKVEAALAAKEATCPQCGQPVSKKHLQDELKQLRAVRVDKASQCERDKNAIEDARKRVEDLASKVEDFGEAVHSARSSLEEATSRYTNWEAAHKLLEDRLQDKSRTADAIYREANPHEVAERRAQERITKLADLLKIAQARVSKAEAEAENYKYWNKAFKDIRMELIDEALHELEITTNSYAEQLGLIGWAIRFNTEKEVKGGNTKFGMYITLFPPGVDEPVRWESYSGGESQRWHLAVTFALSEILLARAGVTPNVLVLDEPTQHMSPAGVDQLLEYLHDRAKDERKSIYLVDHASFDRGEFEEVIVVEKDEKGSYIKQ